MKEKASVALEKMAVTCARMAEQQATATIGRHVIDLLNQGRDLSLTTLTASLENEINSAPSMRGNGDSKYDLVRLAAEKALTEISLERAS